MLTVKFLEGIVGEHDGAGPLGDPQDEGIATSDGTGRRGDDFTVQHGLAHLLALGLVNPVLEGCIHHDGDTALGIFLGVRPDRFVQLLQARERASFGGQVRPVHHDVMRFSQWRAATSQPAPTDGVRHFRWRDWPIRSD